MDSVDTWLEMRLETVTLWFVILMSSSDYLEDNPCRESGMKETIVVCKGLLDLNCGLKVFVVSSHTEFYFLENGHFQHFSCNNSCSDEVLSISLTSFQKLVCEGDNSFNAEHWTFYSSLGRITYITIMLASSIKSCLK